MELRGFKLGGAQLKLRVAAHSCNPSYWEGGHRRTVA
jgi:hypothetical protein